MPRRTPPAAPVESRPATPDEIRGTLAELAPALRGPARALADRHAGGDLRAVTVHSRSRFSVPLRPGRR